MRRLIYGGSASGKSRCAELAASALPGPRFYIATMRPWDEECRARIEKHRRQRAGLGFTTIEHYGDLRDLVLPARGTVLLECMGNLVTNVLFGPGGPPADPLAAVTAGLARLSAQCSHLIVVSNDVFSEDGGCDGGTRAWLDLLAGANRWMGREFDAVTEVVCGIPVAVKGAVP